MFHLTAMANSYQESAFFPEPKVKTKQNNPPPPNKPYELVLGPFWHLFTQQAENPPGTEPGSVREGEAGAPSQLGFPAGKSRGWASRFLLSIVHRKEGKGPSVLSAESCDAHSCKQEHWFLPHPQRSFPHFPPTWGLLEGSVGLWCSAASFISSLMTSICSSSLSLRKNSSFCPGWRGFVDWEPACEPKGHWFNSQSGHIPGLRARSPVGGAREVTTHWCFSPCLSPSLPLYLK